MREPVKLVVVLAAASILAALPFELQLHERSWPTVSATKVMAKDGGGSDDSGSGGSGSGGSGSDDSGSDDSGGSDSSGHGGGDDGSDDDNSGSGNSGSSDDSGSSSGSGKHSGQRSVGDFLGLLKKKGEIAKVTRTQNGVVVRYTDGWREQVVGGSYQLIDRKDRIVVRRAASKSDLQRLLAAAP